MTMGRIKHRHERLLLTVAAGLLLFWQPLALPSMAATKEATTGHPEIIYDAASTDFDYKKHTMHGKDVVITYGTMKVRADKANADSLDFKNSRWTFAGNVRIDAEPRGNLRSDEAIVEIHDDQLTKATATGKPAEFEQKRADTNQVARGHADEIVYEVDTGTVRLSNDAYLSDGHSEITGPVLVYNLREEHVEATTSPDTGQRVHIVIAPRENTTPKSPAPGGSNKPQPTGTPPAPSPQP